MVDKIILSGLQFRGFHGVLPEEQTLGQLFIIDLELSCDFNVAAATDDILSAINYAEVYATTKLIVEGERCNLIETVAEKIAVALLTAYKINKVKVRVNKPHAPIPGIFGNVAVEITRGKNNADK